MTVLSSGTDDITALSGVTIGTASSVTIGVVTYINQTVTYNKVSSTTSDTYYQVQLQSISVIELNILSITPDLSCSFSGSTLFNYSISNYGSSTAPSWVKINSSTGQLSITSPSVNSDSDFYFYVMSLDIGSFTLVQKPIKLTVTKCQAQNWQKCSSLSVSICEMWSSDYTLKSGSCIIASDAAKALSITIVSMLGISFWTVTVASFMNPTSTASLWSMINQAQLLLLLLLTGAFIPIDVKNVILGSKFALNFATYFDFLNFKFMGSIINVFEFELSNQSLQLLGINSDSSIFNISPIITWFLAMISLHLQILLLSKLMPTEVSEGRWKLIKSLSIKFINRLLIIFTFGWYIRYIFETNQYVLISWINEIYSFKISDSKRILSLLFSIIVLWLCFCLIFFVSWLSLSSYEVIKDQHNKIGEVFSGLEMKKRNKLYVSVLLIRRAVIVILLITFQFIKSWILIAMLSLLQTWYLIYIIILRPFQSKKDSIVEIVNEIFFSIFLSSLIFLTSEDDWNQTLSEIYMWFIISNTMIVFIIIICKLYFVIAIVDFIRILILLAKTGWKKYLNKGMIIFRLSYDLTFNILLWILKYDKLFVTKVSFYYLYKSI